MNFNYLPRTQWKYLQYLLNGRQLQQFRRHINHKSRPVAVAAATNSHAEPHLFYNIQPQRCYSSNESGKAARQQLERLNTAQNSDELLDLMVTNEREFLLPHIVQCLSLLWADYKGLTAPAKVALTERLLQEVLPMLEPHIPFMNINELSCCYLYLRKMYVSNRESPLEQILLRALHLVEITDPASLLPLTALSRLSVGINLEREFFTPLVCRHFVPHLQCHIAACKDEEQVRLLATSLFQLHTLIDAELLAAYKERVKDMLQNGVLSSETPKALLKILHMLNLPVWAHRHTSFIREIMLSLAPCLEKLEPSDLKAVCRTFLHHQEPASLLQPLKLATETLLQVEFTPDALSCAVPFAAPHQRDTYIAQFQKLLHSQEAWELPNASSNFFSVLRTLKIADIRYCNTYWSTVVDELQSTAEEQMQLRFLRHCQRYMNFNNNLGGTYRHLNVERKLSQMCMHAIEYDVAGRLPSKFARLAAFVIAYGHTPFAWKKFPNVLLSKIIGMATQFSTQDCFLLSRGIQIACEMRFRYEVPHLVGMQLSTIDSVLVACAERHLADSLTSTELGLIVRTLSHRKSLKNTVSYNQALARFKTIDCNDLNSRTVREMAYNFNASHFIVPELLESMFCYVAQQHAHITGDTVEKVLTCSYNLGYTPENLEALDYAALVLLRDFDYMSGLSMVQACLALCFYKTIPEELINKVFCVKFIQRIEDEIHICYSKAVYPERVLNLVMQLNRTVCLDLPEANVPWFQQNYVEAQLSKKPYFPNSFSTDVKALLRDLLKDENYFRCNHTTPYGYQIDFVIHFDKDKKPTPAPPVETTMLDRITKVAILLLRLDSFCENDLTALRGPESLKIKHLEMMGYKVLHINEHDWNSKYMLAPGAKANYLKCLLQIAH
ncbi:uncharacterized protein LOC115626256 isoform X2 [Scaptodrosophila lebanonensis]|uniref:Uncharacterized protein LOC115626256 isoform X2 n=1 Tax=Drosophila lebanonensis TaxID=7225 RepID=A0A6J2TPI3_DROLE|nr:uncharacterized protein LOC115626256 isoform X2 [Scaptodrosophila lebanonensis]